MSVICALHHDGRTWIGSDTAANDGGLLTQCDPKWTLYGEWAVGAVGSSRTGDLIALNAEALFEGDPLKTFPNKLQEILKEHDFNTDTEAGSPSYGVNLMLANPSGVWDICSGLSLAKCYGFWAQGSGRSLAIGAAYARVLAHPDQIVKLAVEAAIQYDTGCGGKPWVHCVGN